MYCCNNCGCEFDEPIKQKETFESYYGVSNLFPTSHDFTLLKCPKCGDDDIEEMVQCDRCEEFFREDDLTDTEELVGGGIGFLCYDCIRDCEIGGV